MRLDEDAVRETLADAWERWARRCVELTPQQWSTATRCRPWGVRELVAHVYALTGRCSTCWPRRRPISPLRSATPQRCCAGSTPPAASPTPPPTTLPNGPTPKRRPSHPTTL